MAEVHSKACATIPPVHAEYTPKGSWSTVAGLNTYISGSPSATKAILIVYDVFGPTAQCLQGADILAHTYDSKEQFLVIIPDFFAGSPVKKEWFPQDTDEKKAALSSWRESTGSVPNTISQIKGITHDAKFSTVTSWGGVGFCWGHRVLSGEQCGSGNRSFKAVASGHPSGMSVEDGESIDVPFMLLASKDEDPALFKEFGGALKGEKHLETFKDSVHGWMTARADLNNQHDKAEYERAWGLFVDWFHKHL